MTNLLELYVKLGGLVLVGFILGRKLPMTVPTLLGRFLYWVGVPISIVSFLRQSSLSAQVWIAPAIAYLAILLGAFLGWVGMKAQAHFRNTIPQAPTQASFLLTTMFGNTGFLGFPITLAMVGKEYFAWALFYDLLGSFPGSYGLGVFLAARFGGGVQNHWYTVKAILINPGLWSFGFGLVFREVAIPTVVELFLEKLAWTILALSLVLIGMRLALLNSWRSLPQASISLIIKMLLVPLILGSILPLFGLTGSTAKVIVLQMAMPPAFATLVIAEAFNLDRDLAVTALASGVILLLVTLPIWLWLF
ncbi:transporter [Nostoc linckia z18]|uniref:Transporter n=3 Tax=Nostoc TaxID=1177 RepID=A0A9Q5Z7Y3_NOSLI|nr:MULTISPECIES: AEC family transporter [Nostoc]MBL1199173.1 AEC family transporter [Nostoc sp. GBBB01]MDZ8014495.1 AEC family transporter [Nostoc sp. ZfuVER08]PHK31912.1 transporter [Nostoc linckia z15]PHK46410.1 transporter [Nostoc linckia z16]MBD2614870.1 AEC family transporter [Nostoc punctiforme FACHB-252]